MLMLLQGKQKLILPPDPVVEKRGKKRNEMTDQNVESVVVIDLIKHVVVMVMYNQWLYRVEVGRMDGVEVRHLMGAIANEGDINNRYIGHIKLYDDYSTMELPQGMPKELLQLFKRLE